jgi:hypothetical protein
VRWRSADLIDGGLPRSAIGSGSGNRGEASVVDILTVNGTSLLVYQPQAIDWTNHQTQTTGEAIAISKRREDPDPGYTEISFETETDAATSEVLLSDPKLLASHFPGYRAGDSTGRKDQRCAAEHPSEPGCTELSAA